MLSDPLSVTYNSVAKSLPAVGAATPATKKLDESRCYRTADGEFEVRTLKYTDSVGMTRFEISLSRATPDSDTDPFNDSWHYLPNSFGLVYEVNDVRFATSVDIPLLRTALLALVDSTLQSRILGGEL